VSPENVAVVLCTFPVDHDVAAFAHALVNERLAACVNVLPSMRSIYLWQGNVEEASEHQLLIKTTAARVEALKSRLPQLHPYDVPELLVLDVRDGAPNYLAWVRGAIHGAPGPDLP